MSEFFTEVFSGHGNGINRRLTPIPADLMKNNPQTDAVIGAALEVHRERGEGFLEAVYQDGLAVELASLKVPFEREKLLQVRYKGGLLPSCYKADFICFGSVLVECKAIAQIGNPEIAQTLNYLKVTGLKRALVINFAPSSLEYRRLVLNSEEICANPGAPAPPTQTNELKGVHHAN